MLVIRREQMAVLEERLRTSFEERAAYHLLESFEGQLTDGPDLRKLIRTEIDKAVTFGIEAEADVIGLLELLVEWNATLNEAELQSLMGESLISATISPGNKVRLLHLYLEGREGD